MAKRYEVKIVVLGRVTPKEIFKEYPVKGKPVEACTVYEDGQEFIVDESGKMPEGFCAWAWEDISKSVHLLRFGGNYPWYEEEGISINCCTDGLRPVLFKLERI